MFELDDIARRLQSELGRVRAGSAEASVVEWVQLVGSCQRLINMAASVQTVALAQVAAIEDVVGQDGTIEEQHRGLGHQRLDAPALVQDPLGLTASGATDRVATAVDLVTRHPGVVEAMGEGRLDAYRAGIVAQELAEASAQVCAEVVDRIGPRLGAEPGGVLRRRTRRVLASVDADLVRRQADRARGQRSLRRTAFAPGVDQWSATLPVEQSRTAWSVVDSLARRYLKDGRCTGIEQARADALTDLIHARATGEVTLALTVPASELAAESQTATTAATAAASPPPELVPVTGFGMPGVTHVRASWLASVARRVTHSPPGERAVDVVACHDSTGALTSLPLGGRGGPGRRPRDTAGGSAADVPAAVDNLTSAADRPAGCPDPGGYRPPQWMIDFVKARDGQCRFPGCVINARFCDVDHVIPWPVGPTHPSNLVCLCRRHHRIKQRPRWRARLDLDGTLSWTDPTGREHTTLPLDQLQRETPTAPPTPTNIREHPGRTTGKHSGVASEGDAAAPSAVEDSFEHLIDVHLVELACRPANLTAHNRKALQTGRRIHTNGIDRRIQPINGLKVEATAPRGILHAADLWTHNRRRRRGRGFGRHEPDRPPPF